MLNLDMLSDLDKRTLEMESRRWKYAAQKDETIVRELGETPTAYYARVNELLKNPEAAQWMPQTVHRLLRLQEARREQRSADRMPD